jgi:hypothetical protein
VLIKDELDLNKLDLPTQHIEREQIEITDETFDPDNNTVAIDLNNLALVLKDLGDMQGAKKCFERSLIIYQERLGKQHLSTRKVRKNLESLNGGKH